MKRLIAMLLAMLMVLSLVGCGSNSATKKITKAELNALKGEKDIAVLREDINSIDDFAAYLRAMNFSGKGDYSTAEQLLEFGGSSQPRAYCDLLTSVLDDDYPEVGIIHVFKKGVNHYFYSYVKIEETYHALDTFFSGSLRMNIQSANLDELATMCLEKSQVNGPMDQYEITRVMGPLGKVEAPNGEMLTIRERLGEEVVDYCGTQIPVGLGLPKMTDDEIDALIAKADYAATAQTITTLADAVNYICRAGIVFDDISPIIHDPEPAYSDMQYVKSAWQVLRDNSGQCWTMSNLLHYFLKEDYEEVGYIHARTPGDGHLMAYIYHNGKYYLVNGVGYCADTWESRWFGSYSTELTVCAEDFQTIADSLTQYMRLGDQELVNYVHLIKSPGDLAFGMVGNTEIYPVGTEVIRYYGPDFAYQETSYDWQSQTYCK